MTKNNNRAALKPLLFTDGNLNRLYKKSRVYLTANWTSTTTGETFAIYEHKTGDCVFVN